MIKCSGSVCIISAPSGTGKSTLIQALQKKNCFLYNIQLSISYTTRAKRSGEINGQDYYFISTKKFKYMIKQNMFFEYARVFNHYYGTEKDNIKTMLNTGTHIILNIDWQGAQQIKNQISDVYTIFILPPSKKVLEHRLQIRGKDTNQTIINRMQTLTDEIHHFKEYDYVIINDNFDIALSQLQSIILSQQLRVKYQKQKYDQFINHLLYSKF